MSSPKKTKNLGVSSPHPKSPRDATPIIIDGKEFSREVLKPIGISTENTSNNSVNAIAPAPVTASVQMTDETKIDENKVVSSISQRNATKDTRKIPPRIKPRARTGPYQVAKSPNMVACSPISEQKTSNLNFRSNQSAVQPPITQAPLINRPTDVPLNFNALRPEKKPEPIPTPEQKGEMASPEDIATSELRKWKEKYNINDFSDLTSEQTEIEKQEIMCKLRILKNNKDYEFPPIPENLSLDSLHIIYNMWLETMETNTSIGQYQSYLILLFMGLQYVMQVYLGFDCSDFIESQKRSMYQYRRALIELGERRGSGISSSLPPELQIVLTSVINCIIFTILRSISNKIGPSLTNTLVNTFSLGSFVGSVPGAVPGSGSPAPSAVPREENNNNRANTNNGGGNGGGIDLSALGALGNIFSNLMRNN